MLISNQIKLPTYYGNGMYEMNPSSVFCAHVVRQQALGTKIFKFYQSLMHTYSSFSFKYPSVSIMYVICTTMIIYS